MRWSRFVTAALVLTAIALPASAHPSPTAGNDSFHGFVHPFAGLDHLLAMVSVGLLAARQKRRSWLLPVLFAFGMLAGGAVSLVWGGDSIGGVEQFIAATVVALGLMLVIAHRLPTWFALAAVPTFAVFHGHAHLTEAATAGAAGLASYMTGMIAGSLLLIAVGIGGGRLVTSRQVQHGYVWRVAGGAIACAGVVLFVAV